MKEAHEVVISGMSGSFPSCDNTEELLHSLRNGVNLVTDKGRWKPEDYELEVPHQIGKIRDPYVCDLTFFGITRKVGECMDPNLKLILENSVAAIYDAGLDLDDIAGKAIATMVGSSLVETEFEITTAQLSVDQSILSHSGCMQANRLAYFLDVNGPSYVCNSGWHGSMVALKHARDLIARGIIEAAVVAGSNLLFLPSVSYHYQRLGRLNEDGKTKCFSNDADGYSRSEACVVFFLQRKQDALRNYGTVLAAEVNENGFKEGSISDCSAIDSKLLKRIYDEKKIDPSTIAYLEASGCASKIVDANELNMVSEVLLKDRTEPLLIGSVKSNLGHTETISGNVGVVKALLSSEHDEILPNLNYSSPNNLVPALISGQLQVVTEPQPLKGDLIAVNNISASGGFAHVILKRNNKSKKRKCQVGVLPSDGLPRIVFLSARGLDSLNQILDKVEKMPIDEEFIALVNNAFSKGVKRHRYRGYTVLHDLETTKSFREVKEHPGGEKRPLWFVFAGMGSQWVAMGADLMQLPTFAKAVNNCHKILEPFKIDLINIITNPHPDIFNDIFNCFIGIIAVQIGLIDIIKELELEPDGLIGHSLGELGCAYADGSFTAEQMIMCAYYRGRVSAESGITDGLMAAVGKGYHQLKDMLPEGIDIACRNSSTSCTISGPAHLMNDFIETLGKNNIFVRAVPSGGLAYHSRYIQQLGPAFLDSLKKLVPNPQPRSKKWISSSIPEERWDSDLAIYSSAEYHTNNLLSPVLFEDAIAHIPDNAIILEIAPRGLLQAIIKRAIPSATYISLTTREENGHVHLINAFGKLYNEGVHVKVEKMYPAIEYPVSRGTPSLAPLVTWFHDESWCNYGFLKKEREVFTVKDMYFNDSVKNKYNVLADYKINNNSIIPASMYIDAIIDIIQKVSVEPVTKVFINNLTFKEIVTYGQPTPVRVAYQEGTGYWEFSIRKDRVASGKRALEMDKPSNKVLPPHAETDCYTSEEIYLHLNEMGLSLNERFKLINNLSINAEGNSAAADILWNCDLLSFLDSLFVFITFTNSNYKNKLHLIESITQLYIDFNLLNMNEKKVVKVNYNTTIGLLWADGIEIHHPKVKETNLETLTQMEKEFLIPSYVSLGKIEEEQEEFSQFLELCTKIVLQNIAEGNMHLFSVSENVERQKDIFTILQKHLDSEKVFLTPLCDETDLMYKENIELKNTSIMIINENVPSENTFQILRKSKVGYLFCRNLEHSAALTCLISKKFGKDTYFLYKRVLDNKANSVSVLMSSPNWKEELRRKLAEAREKIVYLAGNYTSLNYIHEVVQQCSLLEKSGLIRFVFIENKCDVFKPEEFKEHLSKDIRINILKNGKWGTYILIPVELPLPITNSMSYRNSVYKFRDIMKMNGINLCALGLNMAGMMDEEKKFQLGVFEYSGEKGGKSLCGIASLNTNTSTLEPDPVFQWDKPAHWTHEDVSAVILSYAIVFSGYATVYTANYNRKANYLCGVSRNTLNFGKMGPEPKWTETISIVCEILARAYRILVIQCRDNLTSLKSILVLNGELPLSQAVIRLALKQGFDVFTTYDDVYSSKKAIKEIFPEVHESNIYKADKSLNIAIMLRTNGKGMDIVVNSSGNTDILEPAMNSLGYFSKFFQVSAKETEPGVSIGLRIFLQSVCWHGMGPESLLLLTKEEKQDVWELVDEGLKNGVMQPIKKHFISPSCYNGEAISQMKDDYVLNKKLVVSPNNNNIQKENNKGLFTCDSEKLYVILGNENILWFDLIQWLISRGGRKFTIMVNNISPLLAKRLSILSQNEHIQISLCPTNKLETADLAQNFTIQTNGNLKIGAIFVFGKEYYNVIGELSKDLNDARIVLIGKDIKGNYNRNSCCQKQLTIDVPSNEKDFNIILKNMDSLLNIPEQVVYIKEFSTNVTDMDLSTLTNWQHLPNSVPSIAYLAKSAGKADWKETRTNCSRKIHNRELSPVFVLPPLRKGQLDRLIRGICHPAFTAVIPPHVNSLQELAQELTKGLEKFNCGVFTIICADWSCNLGLAIGKLLEKNGKVVSLLLLDTNTSWATQGTLRNIYEKTKTAFKGESKHHSNNLRSMFEKGYDILKNRVDLISNSPLPIKPQLKGLCHVFITRNSRNSLSSIKEHYERPIKVHSLECDDLLQMINSPDFVRIINSAILVEHKDSAHPISRDYKTFVNVSSQMSNVTND